MDFFTKAVAIYARKKAGYYYQNNDWGGKSLPVGQDQGIM